MNKKVFLMIILSIIGLLTFWTIAQNVKNENDLIGPKLGSVSQTPVPKPRPSSAPKTFKFDKTTDLKKELESINPVVLESDF